MTTPTWTPLLLNILPFITGLPIERPRGKRLRLLGCDSETNRAPQGYFHFGFGPGSEWANLISSRSARLRTAWWERLSRVAIATALSPAAANDRSSSSSSADHAGPGAVISSPSAPDSTRAQRTQALGP